MAAILLAGILLAQTHPFLAQPQVPDPLRLAITPAIDGVLADQEWDHLMDTEAGPVYFQWEPGKLYWAAKPAAGNDVIVSLDLNGDGWLVGNDNYEIRISTHGDLSTTGIRQLDATDRNGPVWITPRLGSHAITTIAKPGTENWAVEGSFNTEGLLEIKEDSRVGVRVDIMPSSFDSGPSYLPRNMAFLRLRFDKSVNLFSGLVWRPSISNRNVARFDPLKFKFNFTLEQDCPTLQQIDVIGEGYARDAISQMTKPFPEPDRRSNASVDYQSGIQPDSPSGYRVLRATLLAADGRMAVIRTSFRIADLIDFEWDLPRQIRYSQESQVVRTTVTLRSQATGRIDGNFDYVLPDEWSARRGQSQGFLIYYPRGNAKITVEFMIPGGASGTFPVTLKARIGETELSRTMTVTVQ